MKVVCVCTRACVRVCVYGLLQMYEKISNFGAGWSCPTAVLEPDDTMLGTQLQKECNTPPKKSAISQLGLYSLWAPQTLCSSTATKRTPRKRISGF
jgi:hypothetical protein